MTVCVPVCVPVSGYHSEFASVLVSKELATLEVQTPGRPIIVIIATSVIIVGYSCESMWQVTGQS